MYARNVTMQLRPTSGAKFTKALENDILPMLRKQKGFRDEITFLAQDGKEALAVSLWDGRESAETYGRETYPAVLKSLAAVVEGTPRVESFEVSNSTFHKIAAHI